MEAWKPRLTSQASAPPSASRREGSPLSKAWLGGTAASVSHPLENGLVSLSHLGEGRGGRAGCPPPDARHIGGLTPFCLSSCLLDMTQSRNLGFLK